MSLVVGQIVYSSFPQIGYQVFANSEIPERVQSAFVEDIVHKHWDVYEPPPPGYKAGFIHQIQTDHTLFGWLFDDGDDDHGRPHTPYCLGYYLNQPLDNEVVDLVTQCLQKGPITLISRQRVPAAQPEQIELVSDYESAAPGITFTDVQQQQIQRWVQQQLLLRCLFANTDVLVPIAGSAALAPQAWEQKAIDVYPELEKSASVFASSLAAASSQQLMSAVHLSHSGLTAPQRGAPATTSAGPSAGSPPGYRVAKRKAQSEDLARQIISILDETL
jgi:hypothetical protein